MLLKHTQNTHTQDKPIKYTSNSEPYMLHLTTQFNLPDGWRLGSLHFQIIGLFLHLKFSENQGDGVPWICQDGPLTLATRAQASGTSNCTSAGGFTAREIKAGNEPTGTPQGAATCVFRCQSPKNRAAETETRRERRSSWVILDPLVNMIVTL